MEKKVQITLSFRINRGSKFRDITPTMEKQLGKNMET